MPQKYLSSRTIKLVGVLTLCLLLIWLNPQKIFSPVSSIFSLIAYPFEKVFYSLGDEISGGIYFLGSISDLKKENENLVKENDSLSARIAELQEQKRENEILRNELKLAPSDKFDLEAVFITARNSESLGNWIMIDKGSADGIQKDMSVIVSDGILIGKVDEVFPKSSRVTLLYDPSLSVNVLDLETGAKGIIRGEYGLGVMMDMVDQSDVLNQGDTIVTSGLGGSVPQGLLIGKIQEVRNTEDKLFQQALIVPRIKYGNLEMLFVIKK